MYVGCVSMYCSYQLHRSYQRNKSHYPSSIDHYHRIENENCVIFGALSNTRMTLTLLTIPTELIATIVAHLEPEDLALTSQTCHQLRVFCLDDKNWRRHIQDIVPYKLPPKVPTREGVDRLVLQNLIRPGNVTSWLDVWRGFHHFWFILKRRLWISDRNPNGDLIIALFELNTLQIKGYRLIAQNSFDAPPAISYSERDTHVAIPSFDPVLTRHRESFTITHPGPWTSTYVYPLDGMSYSHRDGNLPPEIRCSTPTNYAARVVKIILARDLPLVAIGRTTSVWPPLSLPGSNRVRNPNLGPSASMGLSYHVDYESRGYRPGTMVEKSVDAFRLTSSPQTVSIGHGRVVGISHSSGESLAAIHESVLYPTAEKPFQGIWIGDYNGHGNEFVLFQQPGGNDSTYFEMPEHARSVLSKIEEEFPVIEQPEQMDSPYKGPLIGVKLTGDRNVPRSEYTVIVPNLAKVLRVANERSFKDALVVRALAHLAGDMFTNGM
jgi:hypothetical protein